MSKFQRRHYEAIAETLAFSDASDRTITFFVNMYMRLVLLTSLEVVL